MMDALLLAGTSIPGLDNVIEGGFGDRCTCSSTPGAGKTTIALNSSWPARRQRPGIYVSLAETEEELRQGARSTAGSSPTRSLSSSWSRRRRTRSEPQACSIRRS
jgi:KaiC/GvpD/RAD55 family RecA-like ATPase